jgi:hypothetical protein
MHYYRTDRNPTESHEIPHNQGLAPGLISCPPAVPQLADIVQTKDLWVREHVEPQKPSFRHEMQLGDSS